MAKKSVSVADTTRQMDWDDDSVRGGLREKPEKYVAKAGRVDIIRVMTRPVTYYGAQVQFKNDPDKGFFAQSLARIEDIEQENDAACKKACPLFARGYDIKRKFACLIVWVGSVDRKGNVKKAPKPIVMSMGPERYGQLRSIVQSLPPLSNGKPRKLHQIELRVECTDDRFQKLTMLPLTAKSQMSSTLDECKELVADLFEPEGDLNGTCSMLTEFLEPEAKKDLENSLDRAEGRGKFADDTEDDLDTEDDEPKKPARGKKPKPSDDDDADADIADDINDILDDAEDVDDDEDEPKKPNAKKPASKKPKPSDDDDGDDDDIGEDDDVDEDDEPAPKKPSGKTTRGASPSSKKPAAKKPKPEEDDSDDEDDDDAED